MSSSCTTYDSPSGNLTIGDQSYSPTVRALPPSILSQARKDKDIGDFSLKHAISSGNRQRAALGATLDFSEASGYYGIFAFLPRVHITEQHVPVFFLIVH